MITGNKGEWSEIYTLFKLLADKKLYSANENLEKIEGVYYPILKILRENDNINYKVNSQIKVLDGSTEELIKEIPVSEFIEQSKKLLQEIKEAEGRSFSVEETEKFMEDIKCQTLKSSSGNKRDITIKIHDEFTGHNPTVGFSIKSKLGSSSTLFNSSGDSTNFKFRLENCNFDDEDMEKINNISGYKKLQRRISKINEKCTITFDKVLSNTFRSNLVIIDSKMPEIIGCLVLNYFNTDHNKITDLVNVVSKDNPCNYNSENHNFYEYKMKNFLMEIALGMTSSEIWKGEYDATGGYIVVREDGELLCYHIYNLNKFKDYLYMNTKLDSPSSSRHNYGSIYKEADEYHINLNLQIRFN